MEALMMILSHLLQLGFWVFPVHSVDENGKCTCGQRDCTRAGKHPRIHNWPDECSNRLADVEHWVRQYGPGNFGVVTGIRSGIFVTDVDGRHNGFNTLTNLESRYGTLPRTFTVRSGDGQHSYWKHPGGTVQSRSAALGLHAPGIDVKGDGGYVVAPGSRHFSGATYTVVDDSPIAEPPAWLLDLLRKPEKVIPEPLAEVIPEGRRNATLTKIAGSLRRHGATQEVIEAALRHLNENQCTPPLPEAEVRAIARSISHYQPAAEEEVPVVSPTWPEPMNDQALHGLAGQVVRTILPQSEADPASLLVQFLVAFGNVIGAGPCFHVESTVHHMNTFVTLVGPTAKARKGTSWGHIRRLFEQVDPGWARNCVKSGLASGEALIWHARDVEVNVEKGKDEKIVGLKF